MSANAPRIALEGDVEDLCIVLYPDAVLRIEAVPIEQITPQVRAVANRMLQLMHEAPGVGLAAPQVGLSWRMFVANPTGDPADDRVFINPVLRDPSRQTEDHEEGCLSIPNVNGRIRRPRAITVTALDLEGHEFSLTSDELSARIWQHETDHLDGVLIIDRMNPLDKKANRRAIEELEE